MEHVLEEAQKTKKRTRRGTAKGATDDVENGKKKRKKGTNAKENKEKGKRIRRARRRARRTIAAKPNGNQRRGTEAGLTANEMKLDLPVSQSEPRGTARASARFSCIPRNRASSCGTARTSPAYSLSRAACVANLLYSEEAFGPPCMPVSYWCFPICAWEF